MHEMLGNQYFMIRNFSAAKKEFEQVLLNYPDNKKIKKKLVVCYTQIGKVEQAFKLFQELVKSDIEIVINTQPDIDDCPCPELIQLIEQQEEVSINLYEANLILAMLWLYCNKENSLKYFYAAKMQNPTNKELADLISTVKTYLESHPTEAD